MWLPIGCPSVLFKVQFFSYLTFCIRIHTCLGVNSLKVSASYLVITFVSGYVQLFDRHTFDVIRLYYCGMERVALVSRNGLLAG